MGRYRRGTKERAIEDISALLERYSGTKRERLLSYWLSEYSKYIQQEETFKPQFLKHYRRGEIIKANLGYRVGKEEGGPHYAVVLDKQNSPYSDIITILPLSSKKANFIPNKYTLDLGNEIYTLLNEKAQKAFSNSIKNIDITPNPAITGENIEISVELDYTETQKIIEEINSMKTGSLALISQITTISKMRIMKPLRTTDALSNIRLSDRSLDLIDRKIMKLYIGNSIIEE